MNCNDIDEMIYDKFEYFCFHASYEDIKKFINKYNIDVNYKNGYYLELIVERNDLDIFKMFLEYGGNIHLNNECVLRSSAHDGNLEFVKFILEQGGDYHALLDSTALTNYKIIHDYINNYINNLL